MRIGVVFPHSEIGNDGSVIRDYAQTAEGLGYSHIVAYDHVLGASTKNRPGWTGYTSETPFHESFLLFGRSTGCDVTFTGPAMDRTAPGRRRLLPRMGQLLGKHLAM